MTLSENTRATIFEMAKKGATPAEIEGETGVSVSTIYRMLREQGSDRQRRSSALPKERADALCKEYAETKTSVAVLLVKHVATYQQLYRELAIREIPLRKFLIPTTAGTLLASKGPVYDKAVEMYQAGEPLWKIKAETGIQPPALYQELHARGIATGKARKEKINETPSEDAR